MFSEAVTWAVNVHMQVPCRDRSSQSKLPLDAQWLAQVAYLAHVFEHLNILNVTPQVRGHNIFEQAEKFVSFQNNIALWAGHVLRDKFPP